MTTDLSPLPTRPPPAHRGRMSTATRLAAAAVLAAGLAACQASPPTTAANPPATSSSATAPAPPSSTAPSPPPTSKAPATTQAVADPLTDKGWTASDVQLERSSFGDSITARVTNNDPAARSAVFTLTVFGPGKQRLGQTQGSADQVAPGQTVTVTFIGSTDPMSGSPSTYSYQMQTDVTY